MTRMHHFTRFLAVAALVATTVSCGSVVREGRGSSFIVIDSLLGIRGAPTPGEPSAALTSDVITNVIAPAPCTADAPCPTIFGDGGEAVMRIVMKDAGSTNPTTPGALNHITLKRYRVVYTRADGRNTPGVDVPYPFDGALTVTVTESATSFGFQLVRNQAKSEAPLVFLRNNGVIISEIATVTFYGTDQTGNEVTVSGNIGVNFGNFGDQ
jgi:hypothetical protein